MVPSCHFSQGIKTSVELHSTGTQLSTLRYDLNSEEIDAACRSMILHE